MYKIVVTRTAQKSIKRVSVSSKKKLLVKIKQLINKPKSGNKLKGKLSFLFCLHTRVNKTDYRVVYEINLKAKIIIIHYVATRENFYKKVGRLGIG